MSSWIVWCKIPLGCRSVAVNFFFEMSTRKTATVEIVDDPPAGGEVGKREYACDTPTISWWFRGPQRIQRSPEAELVCLYWHRLPLLIPEEGVPRPMFALLSPVHWARECIYTRTSFFSSLLPLSQISVLNDIRDFDVSTRLIDIIVSPRSRYLLADSPTPKNGTGNP